MNKTYTNFSDNNLILFESDKFFKQKVLYKYIPKLKNYLQYMSELDFQENFQEYQEKYNELISYIKQSLTPELNYLGYITPGNSIQSMYTGATSENKYIYAVSMLALKNKFSVAIDIKEVVEFDRQNNGLFDPSVYEVVVQIIRPNNRLNSLYEEVISKMRPSDGSRYITKGMMARNELASIRKPGIYDSISYINWVLTRDHFKYVSFDTKAFKNRITGKYNEEIKQMREHDSKKTKMYNGFIIGMFVFFVVAIVLAVIFAIIAVKRVYKRPIENNITNINTDGTQEAPIVM